MCESVSQLHRGHLPRGEHEFAWDGLDDNGVRLGSGVYMYRIDASGETLSGKLALLK